MRFTTDIITTCCMTLLSAFHLTSAGVGPAAALRQLTGVHNQSAAGKGSAPLCCDLLLQHIQWHLCWWIIVFSDYEILWIYICVCIRVCVYMYICTFLIERHYSQKRSQVFKNLFQIYNLHMVNIHTNFPLFKVIFRALPRVVVTSSANPGRVHPNPRAKSRNVIFIPQRVYCLLSEASSCPQFSHNDSL